MAIIINILQKDKQVINQLIVGICVIGRSIKSDCKLTDNLISGLHGSFHINDLGCLIYKDLESTNGSYLNGVLIKESRVKVNDRLQIGSALLKIDELRLSPREAKEIGESHLTNDASDANDCDELTKFYSIPPDKNNLEIKKALVAHAQELKARLAFKTWIPGKNEALIDKDEPTGLTQFIKLEKKK